MLVYSWFGGCTRIAAVTMASLGLYATAYAADVATQQKTEAVAEKVEKKAEQSEKAEGSKDLVKDEVQVKDNAQGEPVIEQKGEASWYGSDFHGKKTANGEKFDQHKMTAAHPTLPLGTDAKVTNLETGKSVDVEITDRGPYKKGRDIDMSKAAAKKLGMTKDGDAPVKIEAEIPAAEGKTK